MFGFATNYIFSKKKKKKKGVKQGLNKTLIHKKLNVVATDHACNFSTE